MSQKKKLKIGLIVNAYAGIGGEAALKGSDNVVDQAQAYQQQYHTELRAPKRVERFLKALHENLENIHWLTGSGTLGADYLKALQIPCDVCYQIADEKNARTTAKDTKNLAGILTNQQVDLLVFAGGDGTARDVFDVVGLSVTCLGLPSGVKMQSGVFAITPECAADVVKVFLSMQAVPVQEQDVRDIDEQALRDGRVRSQYYGSLLTPFVSEAIQQVKHGQVDDNIQPFIDIADYLQQIMEEDNKLMLVGPGRTTAYFMEQLGLPNTLIGFDAVLDGKLIKNDLTANDISELLRVYPDLQVVISPTGHQGMLIGRGNQQLNAEILKQLKQEQWLVVSSEYKLQTLSGRPLLLDTNDSELDKKLSGIYSIITGFEQKVLYPVNCHY